MTTGLVRHRAVLFELAAGDRRRSLGVTPGDVERAVCDGWRIAPEPFVADRHVARGVLARSAVLAALGDPAEDAPPRRIATETWRGVAARAAGDPSSLSAWLNAQEPAAREALVDEVADLVRLAREVWPVLPPRRVRTVTDEVTTVLLSGGLVRLRGTIDVQLDSRHDDRRARRLIVDVRTGMPRPRVDRDRARFAALLSTLHAGTPPFRWVTYYATEGRVEVEDLATSALEAAADRVVTTVEQRVRLRDVAPDTPEARLALAAGPWCAFCRRRTTCTQRRGEFDH